MAGVMGGEKTPTAPVGAPAGALSRPYSWPPVRPTAPLGAPCKRPPLAKGQERIHSRH